MKKLFYVALIGAIILLAVPFVYLNQQQVSLNYYMGIHWEDKLSIILAATWIFGALVGYLLSMWSSFRLRGKLFKLKRALQKAEAVSEN